MKRKWVVLAEGISVPLGLAGLREMINAHPLFVHFPVALLTLSAIFYLFGAATKKEGLIEAGRWTLYAGTLFAALSVWTGLRAEHTVELDAEGHEIVELHEKLGFVILAASVGLSAWTMAAKAALPSKARAVFLAACALLVLILAQQADLGGRLVFLKGAGVGRKSMVSK